MSNLLQENLNVINLGIDDFYQTLLKHGVAAVQVDWKPPLVFDKKLLDAIFLNREKIEKANQEALEKVQKSRPMLIGIDQAKNVIPGMTPKLILHAGPPITWNRMCGPMKGAIIGALLYEGLAKSEDEAQTLAASGEIQYSPCHEHQTVGPMAGVVSYSMPVFILENKEYKNRAYCTMNEGLGKVLRYGAYSDEVILKLKWMENILYPILKDALSLSGAIDLKNIIAQALHMGDELHNRNRAGTSLFYRAMAPHILKTNRLKEDQIAVLNFINGNDHFFLNLSMPASKVSLDAARGVKNSSMLTVMARNGTDFGIQLSGMDQEWFVGPADVPDALFFPGFSKADANPDIGDSAITETAGLGGFAIAASPAIVQFVGGSAQDAINYTMEMYEISVGENSVYQIPYLNFRGTPTGIDVLKVVEKNILPFIDTGVAHKKPGIGQVGAGVLSAPALPFKIAYEKFASSFIKGEK